jgi:hypothetical protein
MKKILIAVCTLTVGGLIYILWRSDTLTMFVWFERLGIMPFIESLRYQAEWMSTFLPNWFIYSLPNALWLFSGLLIFNQIWGHKPSLDRRFWAIGFLLIGIGAEFGQLLGIIPGVFDWQDLFFMIAAVCSAYLVVSTHQVEAVRRCINEWLQG